MSSHKLTGASGTHIIHSWEFENQTVREKASSFVTSDLYKLALQLDDLSLWRLVSLAPATWALIGESELSQTSFNNVAQNDIKTITTKIDPDQLRAVQVFELVNGPGGQINNSLDFDLADESKFIQENAATGTDFGSPEGSFSFVPRTNTSVTNNGETLNILGTIPGPIYSNSFLTSGKRHVEFVIGSEGLWPGFSQNTQTTWVNGSNTDTGLTWPGSANIYCNGSASALAPYGSYRPGITDTDMALHSGDVCAVSIDFDATSPAGYGPSFIFWKNGVQLCNPVRSSYSQYAPPAYLCPAAVNFSGLTSGSMTVHVDRTDMIYPIPDGYKAWDVDESDSVRLHGGTGFSPFIWDGNYYQDNNINHLWTLDATKTKIYTSDWSGNIYGDWDRGVDSGVWYLEAYCEYPQYLQPGIGYINADNTVYASICKYSDATSWTVYSFAVNADEHWIDVYKNGTYKERVTYTLPAGCRLVPYAGDFITGGPTRACWWYTGIGSVFNYPGLIPSGANPGFGTAFTYASSAYVTTSDQNHISLNGVQKIESVSAIATIPANTSIKALVSLDGRQTWKSCDYSPDHFNPTRPSCVSNFADPYLTATSTDSHFTLATLTSKNSGKYYVEFIVVDGRNQIFGPCSNIPTINELSAHLTGNVGVYVTNDSIVRYTGQTYLSASVLNDGVVGMALDLDNHTVKFSYENQWGASLPLVSGDFFVTWMGKVSSSGTSTATLVTNPSSLKYAPPTGYTAGWGTGTQGLSAVTGMDFSSAGSLSSTLSALSDYTVNGASFLDFAWQLNTSDTSITPALDQVTVTYAETNFYKAKEVGADYEVSLTSGTETQVKKLTTGTAPTVKVNILL